jgi:uncharacterized membrane protein
MSTLHRVNFGLALLLVGGAVVGWYFLPERIPVHFGIDGAPDRWADRSLLSWFGPTAIGILTTGLMYGLNRLIPRRPDLVNIPNKKLFLALSPEARAPVIREVQGLVYSLCTVILLMFWFIQGSTFVSARGGNSQGLMILVLLLSLIVLPGLVLVSLSRVNRAMEQARRRERVE